MNIYTSKEQTTKALISLKSLCTENEADLHLYFIHAKWRLLNINRHLCTKSYSQNSNNVVPVKINQTDLISEHNCYIIIYSQY